MALRGGVESRVEAVRDHANAVSLWLMFRQLVSKHLADQEARITVPLRNTASAERLTTQRTPNREHVLRHRGGLHLVTDETAPQHQIVRRKGPTDRSKPDDLPSMASRGQTQFEAKEP